MNKYGAKMKWLKWLLGTSNVVEDKRISAEEFLARDLTDLQYREIYGDNEEAILKAKAMWRRSGIKVIASMPYAFKGEISGEEQVRGKED